MPILKVDPRAPTDDEELDFELRYLRSLTTAERFAMMLRRSREMAEEMLKRGHRRPAEVLKRP